MLPRHDLQHDSPLLENVPTPLRERPCWMGTKFKHRPDGKRDKPPYRVRAGLPVIKADKTNPENWTSFEEAYDALRRGDVDAIGFVSTETDPFTFKDLDGVVDPETGEIDLRASEIVENFPTYWETSISERGLHGICIAKKPGTRCRTRNIEIYDGHSGARFMVITGNQFGPVHEIRPCQKEVDTLYEELFGTSRAGSPPPTRHGGEPLGQEELLKKARNSKTGAKFVKLYDQGDRSGFDSPNEADYALINMLIFWCTGDEGRVEDLFRSSALYRPPPEKHKGYVGSSVRNALRSYTGSYYQPKVLREESTPKQRDVLTPYLTLLLDASLWKGQKAAGAYKAYAALVILSTEAGIKTDAEELRVGADVRRLAEVAGLSRETLSRSSLPFLTKDLRLITWRKGRGNKAGEFILHKPKVPSDVTIKVTTQYFNGDTYGDGLDALAKLIRMRTGASKTGKVARLGDMQTVARLGMVAMFCMVTLITTPRGLNIDELVERTGRRKDHVRSTMHKLAHAGIVDESGKDFFTLATAFWQAYEKELLRSGIVGSERRQKKQHKRERAENERKLKEGRAKVQKPDRDVIDFAAKRREKLDREAARRQFVQDERFLSEDQLQDLMQEEYDRMCGRVQERLARRRQTAATTGVGEKGGV